MTAREIQRRLIHDKRQSTVMPNFTPRQWFESDVIEITRARIWVEYEIKISRADFFADSQKGVHQFDNGQSSKHRQVAAGKGPSRFFFVVPHMLVTELDVPIWAGLIYATERKGVRAPFNIILSVQRKAPYLHRRKFQDFDMCKIHLSAYYRYIRSWGQQ